GGTGGCGRWKARSRRLCSLRRRRLRLPIAFTTGHAARMVIGNLCRGKQHTHRNYQSPITNYQSSCMPRWFIWSLAALCSWGLWAILSKVIGDALSPAHSQALSTLGLVPVLLALGLSRRLSAAGHRWRGIPCAFAAGVLGCGGNLAYYHALNRGGKAATVVPLTALYPLVTIVLAVLLLKEK